MWRQICLINLLIVYAVAIRVPVDDKEISSTTVVAFDTNPTPGAPISPSPQENAEDKQDVLPTYLLPPTQGTQEDLYLLNSNAGTQSEWYPIQQSEPQNNPHILAQSFPQNHPQILSQSLPSNIFSNAQQQESIPIYMSAPSPQFENARGGRAGQLQQQAEIHIPSTFLEPPAENAENHFLLPTPSEELELPYQNQHQEFAPQEEVYDLPIMGHHEHFNPPLENDTPVNFRLKPAEPTLALHLTPPKSLISKHKKPTKLYPKKFVRKFKPMTIPLADFAEQSSGEVPKAKPVTLFNPAIESENEYSIPNDKDTRLFEIAEQKRKLKQEKAAKHRQPSPGEEPTRGPPQSLEQDTSETHFVYPGRNVHPAPLRQAPPALPSMQPPPAGDRTEFRMHGMKGPHSYQFGFDTGKGKNRQFRFEERDNDGHVRGHYGYVDKHGKMRVVNYDADPKLGFRAEAPVETEP